MPDSIFLKIRSQYQDFSAKEQKIADYILANPDTIINSTISDLAKELEIADSTFFQFTRKLGYKGFKDFKISFLTQDKEAPEIPVYQEITSQDNALTIARKVFQSNKAAISDTEILLDAQSLEKAVGFLSQARRIFFFGAGASEIVAHDAFQKFLRCGISVFHNPDSHIQLMEASMMGPDDCAICISHSGRSSQTVYTAQVAREMGARVISITSNAGSPLAKAADVCFISASEEQEFYSEVMSCKIAQMSILDALYVCYVVSHKESSKAQTQRFRKVLSEVKE